MSFKNLDELKKLYIDNFDIGWAVASSFMYRTRATDIKETDKRYISKLIESGLIVYKSFKKILSNNHYDRIYVFNGRYAAVRGVLRLCQKLNFDCYLHERGANIKKYAIYKNELPHDLKYRDKLIKDAWDEFSEENKFKIAESFYEDRLKGFDQAWFSYTNRQNRDLLPENWNPQKKNIVIYNTSEHEFGAISPEYKNPIYKNQEDAIIKIVKSMLPFKDRYHIFLRIHPNLTNVENESLDNVLSLHAENFTIVKPSSKISTYKMMFSSDKVVTFASTMGIEAAFWGKPSILAGISAYRNLGSVYLPTSHDELIGLLLKDLPQLSKLGALIYGYYQNTRGLDFEYYQPLDFGDGVFKGKIFSIKIPSNYWKRKLFQLKNPAVFAKNYIYHISKNSTTKN